MAQPVVGQAFAEYTLDRMLGQGGMGAVYLARHPRLPQQVALKLLAEGVSSDPEIRRRFDQEANAIARLDHPNIIGIHDRGVHDGHLWIAMRYVEGGDASGLNPREVSVERAIRIVAETAAALDYAHSRGVLHRDVKPANILLSAADTGRQERAVLTDFGIARLLDANTQLTSTGAFSATLAYASPEQLSGEVVDHRSDQYSLGCTLFALLSGQPPFVATNPGQVVAGHLSRPLPRLSEIRWDVPPMLDDVLARATAKRPVDRFANCGEFAAAAYAAIMASRPMSPQSRSMPTMVAPQRSGAGSGPNAGAPVAVPPTQRLMGGLLVAVAGLFAVASLLTLCTRSSKSRNYGTRVEVWDSWRHTAIRGMGWAAHLLLGSFALCAIAACLSGLLLLLGAGRNRRWVRRFGAVASGLAFGTAATAVLFVTSMQASDTNEMTERRYANGYTETLGAFATTPKAGFWVLIVAAILSVIAALSGILATRSIGGDRRRGADIVTALLLIPGTGLALAGSVTTVDENHHRGLPTVLVPENSASTSWPMSGALLLVAALVLVAAIGLCSNAERMRPTLRLLGCLAAGGLAGVLVTTLLEAISQMLLTHDWLLHFDPSFWCSTAALVLATGAMVAGRISDVGAPATSRRRPRASASVAQHVP
ncbi:serine/threonine-protein kinase [Nocardia sp. NPDC004582]